MAPVVQKKYRKGTRFGLIVFGVARHGDSFGRIVRILLQHFPFDVRIHRDRTLHLILILIRVAEFEHVVRAKTTAPG